MNQEDNDNTLLVFPCDFPIKIIGAASEEFVEHVLSMLNQHYPDINKDKLSLNYSKGDRYVAITVSVTAQSQSQLDALYHQLSADKQVLMAL